ncbi:MAG: 4Fe-4S binding protein, partial [Lapillicoccus sp.]
MTFAITQSCCNDAHCVSVCPVNCIHPTPDEPGFGQTEMLFIDPRSCIDCGACASACPVDAIFPVEALTAPLAHFAERNRAYFDDQSVDPDWAPTRYPRSLPRAASDLRVAIVGTGPAACYTAQQLLRTTDAHVTMVDRERRAGGLVRYGVAPDHPSTKRVGETFAWLFDHPRLTLRLGVEVGVDVSLDQLRSSHHAVVAAIGAPDDRRLGIAGETLPGCVSAGDFSRWVNGHVDAAAPDLRASRAVVVGTGNVALDVARLLVSDPDTLPASIDPAVRKVLRASAVREVVLLGRRGPERAAYTLSELEALRHLPGVDLVVDDTPGVAAAIDAGSGGTAGFLRDVARERVDWAAPVVGRRIVLRFDAPPEQILGS